MRKALLCAALVMSLFVPMGCGIEARDESLISHQAPALTVSAGDMYRDYAADESAAAAKYKGKVIAVTGAVEKTGVSRTGSLWIKLQTGHTGEYIYCIFASTHKGEIDKIQNGQQLTIKGKGGNKLTDIFLHGCTIQ